ncbi:MAG TPA: hypothetical protein VES39_07175 [Rhodospirillales bacterium]|nr:hypothetical protein [Rhodospirillales bacterium]
MELAEIDAAALHTKAVERAHELSIAVLKKDAAGERRITELLADAAAGGDAGPGGLSRLLDLMA